jgi:hypothetical protein
MTWTTVTVILLVIVAVWAMLHRIGSNTQPDVQVLRRLRKAGSDLTKRHPIEFFLYFPSRESRDRIASTLQAQGFSMQAGENLKSAKSWSIVATGSMVPTAPELVCLRAELGALAAAENGDYDGWGTEVVK